MFNADESAFWYRRTPTTTIGPAPLLGRKDQKERVTVLICCNASGRERVQPFVVSRANRPRSFGGETGVGLGFDYAVHPRAWMNKILFYDWLSRFNGHIAMTPGRRVCLLIDNASSHGTHDDLPILSDVTVHYLPKRTTSILQPLDGSNCGFEKALFTTTYTSWYRFD